MTVLLLMMLLVLLLAFLGVSYAKTKKSPKVFNRKGTLFLLVGYGFVLILATIISFAIPKPESIKATEQTIKDIPDLYLSADNNRMEKVAQKYMQAEWAFPVENKKLTIQLTGNTDDENMFVPIRIKKDETLNGEIKINYYKTPYVVENNLIVENHKEPPTLELNQSELFVNNRLQEYVALYGVEYEFPIEQFASESQKLVVFSGVSKFGMDMLYIRVPRDLEVEYNDDENIYYIDEEME